MPSTPAQLMAHASQKVRDRALALRGQVKHRVREGDILRARVQGSEVAPYRAWADLKRGEWNCSCPDDLNAMCKHVYALLLVAEAAPDTFEAGKPPRRLPTLKGWADQDVERLLERLLEQHPQIVTDWARVVAEDRFSENEDWE